MPRANGIYSIIHPASGATLSAYTYYEIYAGAGGGVATVNGTVINFGESSNIEVLVRKLNNVSGNLYLLGEIKSVSTGGTYIGGTYG